MKISFNFIKDCNVHYLRLARCPSTVKANMQSQFLFIPIYACKISIISIVFISYQLTLLNFNWTNRTAKNRLNNRVTKLWLSADYDKNRIFQIWKIGSYICWRQVNVGDFMLMTIFERL